MSTQGIGWGDRSDLQQYVVKTEARQEDNMNYQVKSTRLGDSGHPPDNGDMEARLVALETFAQDARDRLVRLETKVDNTATKADLADSTTSQVKWIVGTAAVLGAAAITVMTFVLNNAIPKQPQQAPAVIQPSQQAPIIINVPAPVAPQAQGKK